MRRIIYLPGAVVALAGMLIYVAHASGDAEGAAAPIFGVKLPAGYRDWKVISVAHEAGNNNDLRAILGNDVAINASREGNCRSQTAPSLSGWPGVTFRLRKTTKFLAVPNPLLPDPPLTFRWTSRTQENTPRQAGGDSHNLKTVNLPTRRSMKPAFRATNLPKGTIWSLPITRLEAESHNRDQGLVLARLAPKKNLT